MEIKPDFEAQVLAALMIQTNALVSIKDATKLCGISRKEIYRRMNRGTFPKATKLSSEDKAIRKAFYIQELQEWLGDPQGYQSN